MSEADDLSQLSDRIRSFLLKKPKPQHIHVVSGDGQEHDVKVPAIRPRWRDIADTIVTLDPAVIQVLDADGETLRAERILDGADVEEDAGTREIAIPAALSRDPETLRLTHFANLLARAHETGNNFVREFGAIILDRTDRTDARLERVEAAYRSEFHARVQEQLKNVPDGDDKDEMMRAFFGSYFGAKNGDKAPQTPQNGAPKRPRGWGPGDGDG